MAAVSIVLVVLCVTASLIGLFFAMTSLRYGRSVCYITGPKTPAAARRCTIKAVLEASVIAAVTLAVDYGLFILAARLW